MEHKLKKRIGLHIRVPGSLMQAIEKAVLLDLPFFQCFLVQQQSNALLDMTPEQISSFVQLRREKFSQLFCHGSYWINLASLGANGYRVLMSELTFAKKLEFTHFVLHPGFAKGAHDKSQGIDALAFCLNSVLKFEHDITIVLENTTHGTLTVGSDIADFKLLLEKLDKPDKIGFCIDTAHAHSYGYALTNNSDQQDFIMMLDQLIGSERIQLLHLNDTREKCGSRIDRHAVFGEGKIGRNALMRFALHSQLRHIPIIVELPEMALEQERLILEKIRGE